MIWQANASVCVVFFLSTFFFLISPWFDYLCTATALKMKINSVNAGPETDCCT